MSQPKPRDEKVKALIPFVHPDDDGNFWVESLSLPGWQYRVCPRSPNSPATCQCPDHQRKRQADPTYRCIHISAVRTWVLAQRKAAKEATGSMTQLRPPSIAQNLLSMEQHLRRLATHNDKARAYLDRIDPIPKGLAFIEAI